MAPQNAPRTDTKLLLSIAGVVVAGAIGIALVAGWTVRQDTPVERSASRQVRPPLAPVPTRSPVAAGGIESSLENALHEVSTDRKVLTEVREGETPTEADGSTTTEIDADADPWREGNRAYHARAYPLAVAYFEADVAARPERAYSHYMLGLARWKSGDLDGATEALERSASLNAHSVRTFVNLARIHNAEGDYEAALGAAEQAVTIQPDSAVALYQRGRSQYNLGRIEEAIGTLEASLKLDSDEADAHNLLGLIRLQQGDDQQALRAFETAAALEPGAAYIQNNLGLALERSGRPADAAEAYRLALSIDAGHRAAAVSLERVVARLPVEPAVGEDPTAGAGMVAEGAASEPVDAPQITEPLPDTTAASGESADPIDD